MKGTDIPQTESLEQIRRVVQACAEGAATSRQIQVRTGISLRHVNYAIQAAKAVDLLDRAEGSFELAPLGRVLVGVEPNTRSERVIFQLIVELSWAVREVAPGLLSEPAPSVEAIALRIEERAGLSAATADRRARTLLAWRSQILEEA